MNRWMDKAWFFFLETTIRPSALHTWSYIYGWPCKNWPKIWRHGRVRDGVSYLKLVIYRVFIKYCVFPLKFWIFLNSASSAAALVFYLPCVCTHTDTEGEQRKARVWNISKSSEKKTIFNKHPVIVLRDEILRILQRSLCA